MNLLTTEFKTEFVNTYIDKIASDNLYIFAGKTKEYVNESVIEAIGNSVYDTYYRVYDEMLFAKKLFADDVSIAIRNIQWTAGQVYAKYDDKDPNLDKLNFYVITQQGDQYSVFKCLSNNNGAPSVVPPLASQTNPTDEFYKTSDGYIWKLMYTVGGDSAERYQTNKFFPLVRDQVIEESAVNGAIDHIVIEDPGIGYITYASGIISQINIGGNTRKFYIQSDSDPLSGIQNFYRDCAIYITSGPAQGQLRKIVDYGFEGNNRYIIINTPLSTSAVPSDSFEISPNVSIRGDGTGFQARAIIDPESDRIGDIEIISKGSGYTNAEVLIELNLDVVDVDVFSQAEARAILPPKGGHGSNSQTELFGTYVANVVEFFDDEFPVGNDYRQVGIIKNPIITEALVTLDTITGLSVGVTVTQGNLTSATVSSIDMLTFKVRLTNVVGHIDIAEPLEYNLNEYVISSIEKGTDILDLRSSLNTTLTFGAGFLKDEIIIQQGTLASAIVHEYNATQNKIYVTNISGKFQVSNVSEVVGQTSGAKAVINNINEFGIQYGSGEVIFVENTIAINRETDESEQIKIILGF